MSKFRLNAGEQTVIDTRKMRTITSSGGKVETVTVRRTESSDAHAINSLISPATVAVFGRVNVIHLLEKANLAVTLSNAKNEVLAHAAFSDHPIGDIVDQACWEPFLHDNYSAEKYTPLNTLFLHLFVAQPIFSIGSAKEIVRTVFNAITELQYICLVTPTSRCLERALEKIFEPMKSLKDPGPQCSAFVCHRHSYCPRLHVRRARVEDHDDLTHIFAEQTKALTGSYGTYFLAELIEAQDDENHAAVCENEGTAVGFISVSGDINLKLLNECFELGPFNGLYKPSPEDLTETAPEPGGEGTPGDTNTISPQGSTGEVSSQDVDQTKDFDQGGVTEIPSEVSEPGDSQACAAKPQGSEVTLKPRVSVTPNAFCIQLFVIYKNFEMRSVDFLPNIFKLFPDRDFCIISVPKLAPEFPLLQSFLRVVPHHTSSLPQELYIFHRSGMLKTFVVSLAVSADRSAVCDMVKRLSLHESLLEDLDMFYQAHRDMDGTPLQAFVAQVQNQLVGIVIIRNEEDIDYIRANYNIENFIYFSHHRYEEHGQLCHFALNPIFQHYAKHFLKEVLRLAHKSCLYYPIYPSYHNQKNSCAHYLTSVLNCMVPVRPRRQIVYPLDELGINAPSKQITKDQVSYALNHINRKLTMEPKVTINARIVVVGASDTGLAFLEVLAFCPHLRFNNMTLISTHGFPGYYTNEKMRFLSTSHSSSDRDHAQMSLRSWINVVTGKMVGIDRAAKHVLVSGGRKVPYDHLILCTGQQYQVSCPTGVDGSHLPPKSQLPAQPRRRYTGPVPSNLFTLNDHHDCVTAYQWLLNNFVELKGNAIVYGNTIDVYTCVETLLCLDVQGYRIHLVHLPTTEGSSCSPGSCFSNPTVEKAMKKALEKSGVHVHHNCLLAQMNDGQNPEPITSLSFTSDSQPLRLECSVFMNLSSKGVDYDAFKTINDACLVYDGRLVIDTTFHTNDSTIRAAGPLTKFARRYLADQWSHSSFNSREVGQELAAALLPFFDPTLEPAVNSPADLDRLIPIYTQAKIQGGRLPGGYSYLHATKPEQRPSAVHPVEGREILTGRIETGNYFHLHLNQYGMVETITCLSLKPFPVSNYLCLYGKHELLLNRLCSRYDEGLVHDLYSYFREKWCLAIYHDRFADFEQEMHQIMESTKVQDHNDVSISELVQRMVDEKLDIIEEPNVFLKKVFETSGGLASLKTSTLNYLRYNRYHLTMYAQPGLL
ncbi:cilia- and flagella-associated protein 61 isoform X1 [Oncorhynchus mykiss]|uniref:cilia- and flagella-associated protein 61 isoform X1 n=2 Tax=Oncorhynchus mykiss TaxID=8022 RepID=UPI00187888A3|nr:cilia- and flagella-associated protein 61 isoform X1 [Oncorhynchus mykiss]